MWCVGTMKIASETERPKVGLDCTARTWVGGCVPHVGAMSKDARRRERGSCGSTLAALMDAMSLRISVRN